MTRGSARLNGMTGSTSLPVIKRISSMAKMSSGFFIARVTRLPAHEMGTTRLRIVVDDPDALYDEYKDKGVFYERTRLADTPWGTREFALYDLDRNALTFYRNLKKPG